jgi:TIR domain
MATANSTLPHVFISYSRSNRETMQRVSQALSESSIPVWTDENLIAGTLSWKNTIEHALQGAFCVVVLMSPTAKRSEWVERELDYAYVLQRPIYPVLVEGSQRDSVPFELINMQYIDARLDFDQSMKQLVNILTPFAVAPTTVPLTTVNVVDSHRAEPQPPRPVAPEPIASITSAPPTTTDILLYSLGFNREDSDITPQYAARSRRVIRWYFLEPRKFRLFSVITQDSTARLIHALVTMLAYFWILGSAALLWILSSSMSAQNILVFVIAAVIFCYGMMVLVPMATPYKTRRAFFGSLLYTLFLLGLLGGLLWIAIALMSSLSVALEAV